MVSYFYFCYMLELCFITTLLVLRFLILRKYLRDGDRQVLAKRAFFLTVKVLEDNLNSLTGVRKHTHEHTHADTHTSYFEISGLYQESEQPHKASVPSSMGEMTTTDVSGRPSSEEGKNALPKKPGLTEGLADTGPRDASQTQLAPPAMLSTDKGSKTQESFLGKVETAGSEGHKAGPEEPMELDNGSWRKPPSSTEPEAETSIELLQKVTDSSRTPELSLEELSISSRQQQLLPSSLASKVTVATSGIDQGTLRRPNRKRKLLEDVESGKTLLMDAYRVWQQGQKVMTYDLGRIEKIMSETYMLIKQVKSFCYLC